MSMLAGHVPWQGAAIVLQAASLGAGLAPDMAVPLLAVVAQRAAQGPSGRQPLRREFERHVIERGEVGGFAATESDLAHQARGTRQRTANGRLFAFRQQPMAIERTPRLPDDADTRRPSPSGWTARG